MVLRMEISLSKLSLTLGLSNFLSISFTATSIPNWRCLALQTTANEPDPILGPTMYSPINRVRFGSITQNKPPQQRLVYFLLVSFLFFFFSNFLVSFSCKISCCSCRLIMCCCFASRIHDNICVFVCWVLNSYG